MSRVMPYLGWVAVVLIVAGCLWAIWTAATVTVAGALVLTGIVIGVIWIGMWLSLVDLRDGPRR